MECTTQQLTDRVRALERRLHYLLVTTGLFALLAVLGATNPRQIPRQPAELVQAHRIQVVDPEGRVRLDLRHDADETGLFVLDEAGDARLGAAHFAHGGSGYALHGPGGRGAAVLYLRGDGSLTLYDEDGNATERFPDPFD